MEQTMNRLLSLDFSVFNLWSCPLPFRWHYEDADVHIFPSFHFNFSVSKCKWFQPLNFVYFLNFYAPSTMCTKCRAYSWECVRGFVFCILHYLNYLHCFQIHSSWYQKQAALSNRSTTMAIHFGWIFYRLLNNKIMKQFNNTNNKSASFINNKNMERGFFSYSISIAIFCCLCAKCEMELKACDVRRLFFKYWNLLDF